MRHAVPMKNFSGKRKKSKGIAKLSSEGDDSFFIGITDKRKYVEFGGCILSCQGNKFRSIAKRMCRICCQRQGEKMRQAPELNGTVLSCPKEREDMFEGVIAGNMGLLEAQRIA